MFNKINKDKITWKCYPSTDEQFSNSDNDIINNASPVFNLEGQQNYESIDPIVIRTDTQPGLLVPDNITLSLPIYDNKINVDQTSTDLIQPDLNLIEPTTKEILPMTQTDFYMSNYASQNIKNSKISVENKSESKMNNTSKLKKNRLIRNTLIYIFYALVIYLIYLILYEKNI